MFTGSAQPWKNDSKAERWADSVLAGLDDSSRIAQLFVLSAYSNKGEEHRVELLDWVRKKGVGGFIFFQGGPVRQASLTAELQSNSRVPLLISIDGEWGVSMRLDSALRFPWALSLGAVNDSAFHYSSGQRVGAQCRSLGVNWNFAPVLDLNTNPDNPIINARSYGQDQGRVSKAANAFALGLQSQGVLACGKHFPGHGDTRDDSHKTLPVLDFKRDRLEEVELAPFREAIRIDIGSMMVGHLSVPALDSSKRPASLSPLMTDNLLRQQMGFNGLIVTDALNMQGVDGYTEPGDLELAAFLAGSDVLLCPRDPLMAMQKIQTALDSSAIDSMRLAVSVKRILLAKYWAKNQGIIQPDVSAVEASMQRVSDRDWVSAAARKSVVLLKNDAKMLPFDPASIRSAAVVLGKEAGSGFVSALRDYAHFDRFDYAPMFDQLLLDTLDTYDRLVVAVYTSGLNPWKSYKIRAEESAFLDRLASHKKIVLVFFGNPYGLKSCGGVDQARAVLAAQQNHRAYEQAAAELLFSGQTAMASLPVDVSRSFKLGAGKQTEVKEVLGRSRPSEVGMDSLKLHQIDGLMAAAMGRGDLPGAQLLVARKGKIIYHKAFGTLSKHGTDTVRLDHLYDIASITKIASTTLATMHLVEKKKISLDDTLGALLPEVRGTNKSKITLRNLLAHQAGLQAYLPLWPLSFKEGSPREDIYRSRCEEGFELEVADSLFLMTDFKEQLFLEVVRSPLSPQQGYKYSDLGYYFLQRIIERETGKPLDVFVENEFYRPMGLTHLLYRPLERFSSGEIAPTENDRLFRKQLIRGHVHDPGAALMGGVAGHAGLFSNAHDLARLMQMLLQQGNYGGHRFFEASTVEEFTRCAFCRSGNRRGLGFDKPQLAGSGPTCGCTSPNSFGHTGFTGTMVWVDPEQEIVYVFLSNRVHPDASNVGLIRSNLRTEIQQIIYDAIQNETL